MNAALAAMLGYTPGELVGRHAWEVVAPESRELVRRHALAGHAAPYEAVGLRKDGTTFPCEILGKPIRYRGRPARLVAVRDITARQRAEEARAEAARERAAREAAEEAVRVRDFFLTVAAHELKTPVTALKSAAQLLQRRGERGLLPPERLASGLGVIVRSADRLATLINDLLDVSRLRAGQLRIARAPVDLLALLREAVDRAGEHHGETHRITLDAPPRLGPVPGDAVRLDQVLTNLLDNAAKYSPRGGVIAVAAGEDRWRVRVTVRDEGIGLPPGSEEAIFAPFGRTWSGRMRPALGATWCGAGRSYWPRMPCFASSCSSCVAASRAQR